MKKLVVDQREYLLIGFVLADKVEKGVYLTYTVHGVNMFTKPIVLVLIVLTIASIVAAARFKPKMAEMTEDGPHTHLKKRPQLIFYWAIMFFLTAILVDGLQYPELTKLYPVFVFGLAMVFMVPLGIKLHMVNKPGPDYYDSEWIELDVRVEGRTSEHFLYWLVGMLGLSYIFGFEIGVGVFIYAFVRSKAEQTQLVSVICGLAFVTFLGVLAYFLTLEYPKGIVQDYIPYGLDMLWR